MYDDIANNPSNPRPGTIINNPLGSDVYAGVPKDYTGGEVTVKNLYAVILGDKSGLSGGSGKVVESGPDDHIFIFYSDHGGPGVLGMPTYPYIYANDFIDVLKKKYANNAYKEMVIYLEACESGSIFEGLLPEDMNIYVTTASNAYESSWGTYCPGMDPPPPSDFYTCLGDLYSISWMEDSEVNNLEHETLSDQYGTIKARTSNQGTFVSGSHVMQYGDLEIDVDEVSAYLGADPANSNLTYPLNAKLSFPTLQTHNDKPMAIDQRDADLHYLWHKYQMANEGSSEKTEAQKEMVLEMSHRLHVDASVDFIGSMLFGSEGGPILTNIRSPGQSLVDDWDCLKSMVRGFESQCGSLSQYGLKHMRAFANICNAGVSANRMMSIASKACDQTNFLSGPWNPYVIGFSA